MKHIVRSCVLERQNPTVTHISVNALDDAERPWIKKLEQPYPELLHDNHHDVRWHCLICGCCCFSVVSLWKAVTLSETCL
jgi:hypothetical protein